MEFISVSESEYLIKIQEKLLLIEKENLSKIFLEIEKRTESPIPEKIKEKFYDRFQIIQKIIKATIYKYKRDRKLKEFYGKFQTIKNNIEASIDNYKENRKL